jgi:CHASE1-domain containing sensor protein
MFIDHAGERPLLFPTLYVKQFHGANDARSGWDAMSEPVRRAALEHLLATGRAVLTKPTMFVAPNVETGFVAYVPVFGKAEPSGARPLIGAVFSSFLPQRIFASLSSRQLDPDLFVDLRQSGSASVRVADAGPQSAKIATSFASTNKVMLCGSPLIVRVVSTPDFEARGRTYFAPMVLGGGLFFSALRCCLRSSGRKSERGMLRRT